MRLYGHLLVVLEKVQGARDAASDVASDAASDVERALESKLEAVKREVEDIRRKVGY